jgi:hypothetical protein
LPTITTIQLQILSGTFGRIIALTNEIQKKAPNCQTECERIDEQRKIAISVLDTIQGKTLKARPEKR